MFHFVIIGAQRAGTAALGRQLAMSPSVWMPGHEIPVFETRFFSRDGLENLSRLIGQAPANATIGFRRPDYLAAPGVAERIRAVAPEAVLAIVLRDPIDRCISAYYWYVRTGFLPYRQLDDAMVEALDAARQHRHDRWSELIEYGHHAKHLDRWRAQVGASPLLVGTHEEVASGTLAGRLLARLKLPAAVDLPPPSGRREHPTIAHEGRLRLLGGSAGLRFRWADQTSYTPDAPSHITPQRLIGQFVAGLDKHVLARLPGANVRPATLSDEVHARLAAAYDEDIDLLRRVKEGGELWCR